MGLSPPPPIASGAVALALTAALAGCGGGTTGPPVATTTAASSPPASRLVTTAPARTVAGATATPAAPRTIAAAAPRVAPATTRSSGGAAAPVTAPPASTTAASPASRQARAPAAAAPAGTPIAELADLTLTSRVGPAHYFQQGTVTGTYAGTMAVEARITSQGVLVRFTATVPGGTIVGHALAVAILDSATWPGLRGSGVITGGTGRFAGIHARGLTVTGRAKPDASQARVRLAGTVS